MDERDRLVRLCVEALQQNGQYDDQHKARLKFELREIDSKDEHEYFLDLLDRGVKYPENEHNLLVIDLLGIAPGFNIDEPPSMDVGEFPDIDVDFLASVRDYLKNEWCPQFFGEQNVCNIGSYNSYGLKSALIDMARVHGLDRNEAIGLTKKINLKDEDGKAMTWEKALSIYKDLAAYCEKYPEVADAASRLVHRNRSRGKHAGGLIISSKRLDDLVPLTVDNDGNITSAWTEGLRATDLGPMGLVKFDLLGITNVEQIAKIAELIKQRHGLDAISALPGSHDFSDTAYLDDPKALAIANEGRLKGVFQFDSQGIRQLVVKGGVRTFDDLVAYTALYRPGPLNMGMHEHYCERAKGREQYSIHPIMEPILGNTYGVLVYQEQVMQILNKVGLVPLKDCEIVRKAISKKKEELFIKYKVMFIENGQKNLGWTKEQVEELWDQIAAFAEYGFNKSHAVAYTYLSSRLLYLKAHWPVEFFAGILSHETDADKIKDYKQDAATFDVRVVPVDINKSGVDFQIQEEEDGLKVYYGLSNLKGMGKEVSRRITMGQPYASLEDFLDRFGTDANVLKPVIALRLFESDRDGEYLFQYYEYCKDFFKKREDRRKRYEATQVKLQGEIDDLLEKNDAALVETINKIIAKKDRSTKTYQTKVANDLTPVMGAVPCDNIYVDERMRELLGSEQESEQEYYGFRWIHPITLSPDYIGELTFERFRYAMDAEMLVAAPVEVQVEQVEGKTSRSKKKTKYYQLTVKDENDETVKINIWSNEWATWQDVLKQNGVLLRMKLKPPTPPFTTYSLADFGSGRDSWGRKNREVLKQEDDPRIIVYKPGRVGEMPEFRTNAEALEYIEGAMEE